MELTQEQHEAVASGGSARVTIGELECVVVRSDVFDRVSRILGEDWTHEEMRRALARSSRANGWDEPEMAVYDKYQ